MIDLFPTPLFKFDVPGSQKLNKEIIDYVLETEKNTKTRSEAFSLKGKNGWHSKDDLAELEFEWSQHLRYIIVDTLKACVGELGWGDQIKPYGLNDFHIKCWAMVMRTGDYSTPHTHPGCDFSGVYYLQVPDMPETEGNICFMDPRGGARGSRTFGSNQHVFHPVESEGYIFPNWLDHYVQCHFTEGTRISLSWNILLPDQPATPEQIQRIEDQKKV